MSAIRLLRPVLLLCVAVSCGSGQPKRNNLSYADRQEWRKVLKWPDSCEEAFDYSDKSWGGLNFYQLAPRRYLVEVICTRGAYQGFQVYFDLDESKSPPRSRPLSFFTYEASGDDERRLVEKRTTELWGAAQFQPRNKTLEVLNRFRAIGDCGSLARYVFQTGEPRLEDFRAKLQCDGKGAEDPRQWKKVR
jgi:hypothetical protein